MSASWPTLAPWALFQDRPATIFIFLHHPAEKKKIVACRALFGPPSAATSRTGRTEKRACDFGRSYTAVAVRTGRVLTCAAGHLCSLLKGGAHAFPVGLHSVFSGAPCPSGLSSNSDGAWDTSAPCFVSRGNGTGVFTNAFCRPRLTYRAAPLIAQSRSSRMGKVAGPRPPILASAAHDETKMKWRTKPPAAAAP